MCIHYIYPELEITERKHGRFRGSSEGALGEQGGA